jgi:hypothetical protein
MDPSMPVAVCSPGPKYERAVLLAAFGSTGMVRLARSPL